jgi:glutamine cyclotransferase
MEWSNADAMQWLKLNKLEEFKKSFYANGFSGKEIFQIHPQDYSVFKRVEKHFFLTSISRHLALLQSASVP